MFRKYPKPPKKTPSPTFICRICHNARKRVYAHCYNAECTWCLACYKARHSAVKPEGLA